jgi:hypothetical protein
VRKISEGLRALGVEMLLVTGTDEAAGHAEGLGLISPSTSRDVGPETRG